MTLTQYPLNLRNKTHIGLSDRLCLYCCSYLATYPCTVYASSCTPYPCSCAVPDTGTSCMHIATSTLLLFGTFIGSMTGFCASQEMPFSVLLALHTLVNGNSCSPHLRRTWWKTWSKVTNDMFLLLLLLVGQMCMYCNM